jgi:membrane fusion protein, multidrug efflux system
MRRTLLVTWAGLLLGGAVAGFALARGSGGSASAVNPGLPPATAEVTRTTLVETTTVPGTLGYGDPVPVSTPEKGTITWIAPAGSAVKQGEPLFKVDERPVVALYGSLPLYRTLQDGTKGADVLQLERNLAELGYTGLTVDDTYTLATADAVFTWQARLGLPVTGTVEPGQVVFTRGAVRIAADTARVGDSVGGETGGGGAPVLSYTDTSRRVAVQLGIAGWALAVRGRTVTVTIPGRGTVQGKIAQVGTVATALGTSPDGTTTNGGTSPGAGPSPAASDARIEVTVTIADQRALGPLDAAPVDVDFVSDQREDVLAVPVAALLALPEGGFGVQVVAGDATRIVPVTTGMFAAGMVEITGKGIAEGVRVGVPK